jgi:hypothetical protein
MFPATLRRRITPSLIAFRRSRYTTRLSLTNSLPHSPYVDEEAPGPSTLEPSLQRTHPDVSEQLIASASRSEAGHEPQKLLPALKAAKFESLFVAVAYAIKQPDSGEGQGNAEGERERVGYRALDRLMRLVQTKEDLEKVVWLLAPDVATDEDVARTMQLVQTKEELEKITDLLNLLNRWDDTGTELRERHTLRFLGASYPLSWLSCS